MSKFLTLLTSALLATIATSTLTSSAHAQQPPPCGTRAQVEQQIGADSRWDERPLFTYRSKFHVDVEVWVNLDTGSITVLKVMPDGLTLCAVDSGAAFEPTPLSTRPKPGEGA